jgi:hypothetical protein
MRKTTQTVGAVLLWEGGSEITLDPRGLTVPGLIGPGGEAAASVAMRLDRESGSFSLLLLGEDNAPLLTLGPYSEDDIVAEWRRLAATTGLPLKLQLPNGAVMEPYRQLGRVLLGSTRQRRRHGLLAHRRPRFLTRRKTGRFPLRPQVHREAEIAGETR